MIQQPPRANQLILLYKLKSRSRMLKKRAKNSYTRQKKLEQWSITEQAYKSRLFVVRDEIKAKLVEFQFMDQIQANKLFPYLDEMIRLSGEMKQSIDRLLKSWDSHSTILSPTVEYLAHYHRIYKFYCSTYKQQDEKMNQLKKVKPDFNQKIPIPNFSDYTFKPVQRPLQYDLFVKEYIELLPGHHIEKQRLQQARQQLQKVANDINDSMSNQIKSSTKIKLEKAYGDILQANRSFIQVVFAYIFDCKCHIYVFNNLLLLIRANNDTQLCRIDLCSGSFVIAQPDNHTFRNRMYIIGSYQSIHLTFNDPQDLASAQKLINQIIADLFQKQYNRNNQLTKLSERRERARNLMDRYCLKEEKRWKQQVQYKIRLKVQVIGIEQRYYNQKGSVVFMVKYTLSRPRIMQQVVSYDLQQLRQLQRHIKQIYPNINVPSLDRKLPGMSSNDIKNKFTIYYEFKEIIVEDFINFCLRNQTISKKPQYIVHKLKIQQFFWDYLNKLNLDCKCETCIGSPNVCSMASYLNQRLKIRAKQRQFCIVNAINAQQEMTLNISREQFGRLDQERRLLWANSKCNRIDYSFVQDAAFGSTFEVKIYYKLVGKQPYVELEGAASSTCQQIIEKVMAIKKISSYLDFGLVYVHGAAEYYLHNDEFIVDFVKYTQNVPSLAKRYSNEFRISNQLIQSPDFNSNQPKIYLRKTISLGFQYDDKSASESHGKYPLIVGELLRRFIEQQLHFQEYQIPNFCALMYGVDEFTAIIFSRKINCNQQKLKNYLPKCKHHLIDEQFVKKVMQVLTKIVQPCENMIALYALIIKMFGNRIGCITQFFPINSNTLLEADLSEDKQLMLGVNHQNIIVTPRNESEFLLQLGLLQTDVRVNGNELLIECNGKKYEFVGGNLTYLTYLVRLYRAILQKEREGNQNLAQK